MLDELDSLMERMLALPVGDAEELPPLPRDVRKPATVTATLTVEEPAVGQSLPEKVPQDEPMADEPKLFPERAEKEKKPSVPLWEDPAPPTPTPEPPPVTVRERFDRSEPLHEPHFKQETFEEELPPPMAITRPIQIVTSPADDGMRAPIGAGSVYLWPLVWVNRSFDQCTTLLGPLGRRLRGSRGRTLLGIVGIVCLGVAGAWVALEQIGWPR